MDRTWEPCNVASSFSAETERAQRGADDERNGAPGEEEGRGQRGPATVQEVGGSGGKVSPRQENSSQQQPNKGDVPFSFCFYFAQRG